MNPKNLEKVEAARQAFLDLSIIFREFPNGHLKVDTANFWATSEKWHDTATDTRGVGINSFIKHLKNTNII